MKLLLDAGLPRSAAALLRESGLDAVHVSEVGRSDDPDAELLRLARDNSQVLVTLDADFHALLALSGASSPSAVRIRREGLDASEIAVLIQAVVWRCHDDLMRGAVVSVQERRLAVRLLPITG